MGPGRRGHALRGRGAARRRRLPPAAGTAAERLLGVGAADGGRAAAATLPAGRAGRRRRAVRTLSTAQAAPAALRAAAARRRRRRRRPQGHPRGQGPVGEVSQAWHRDGDHQEWQVSTAPRPARRRSPRCARAHPVLVRALSVVCDYKN